VIARVKSRCCDGRGGCVYTWKDIRGWEHPLAHRRIRALARPRDRRFPGRNATFRKSRDTATSRRTSLSARGSTAVREQCKITIFESQYDAWCSRAVSQIEATQLTARQRVTMLLNRDQGRYQHW
jgi:hypothetical protein